MAKGRYRRNALVTRIALRRLFEPDLLVFRFGKRVEAFKQLLSEAGALRRVKL